MPKKHAPWPNSCPTQLPEHGDRPAAVLREASIDDLAAIHDLLRAEALPTEGVDDTLMPGMSVVASEGRVLGSASMEVHGRVGLLRSVVVADELRGRGWGGRLVSDRVAWAKRCGLEAVALFTETAAAFFEKLGFAHVGREDLPAEVHGSFEFGFCPVSSKSMLLRIDVDTRSRIRARYSEVAKRPRTRRAAAQHCGYTDDEIASLPAHLPAASLGCGNPTAAAHLKEGETVLDLGSGGGLDVLLSAGRVGPAGLVYGLEANRDMLALAERNRAEVGATNVRFLEGRLESIPLEDDDVDVVISNCVLNLSLDKEQAYREAFRVLKPGGRLAIADIIARRPADGPARRRAEEALGCLAGTLDTAELHTLLRGIGFDNVAVDEMRRYEESDLAPLLPDGDTARLAGGVLVSAVVRAVKPRKRRSP